MGNLQLKEISVGVDLHKTQFTVCAINSENKILLEKVYPTYKEGYELFVKEMKEKADKVRLAVESTGNTKYFARLMGKEGFEVIIVNTSKFKVIVQSTSKTDKNDAYILAYYLEKDMLPESKLCSDLDTKLRVLMTTRNTLVSTSVKTKNQIHGLLLGYGIVTKSSCFQSKRARKRFLIGLEDQEIQLPLSSIKILFDIIDSLYEQINKIEAEIDKYVETDERIKLLMSIPGVGKILATTIASYTGDVRDRYKSYKHYCAYTGLVPWVKNSNETVHHGHITKRGPKEIRTAFIQCALGLLRQKNKYSSYRILMAYDRHKERIGTGKSIVAMARKISKIAYFMLLKNETFDVSRMIDIEEM